MYPLLNFGIAATYGKVQYEEVELKPTSLQNLNTQGYAQSGILEYSNTTLKLINNTTVDNSRNILVNDLVPVVPVTALSTLNRPKKATLNSLQQTNTTRKQQEDLDPLFR